LFLLPAPGWADEKIELACTNLNNPQEKKYFRISSKKCGEKTHRWITPAGGADLMSIAPIALSCNEKGSFLGWRVISMNKHQIRGEEGEGPFASWVKVDRLNGLMTIKPPIADLRFKYRCQKAAIKPLF